MTCASPSDEPPAMSRTASRALLILLLAAATSPVEAAGVREFVSSDWSTQIVRFFTLQDASVRFALIGSALLGLSCGLLGSFIVVRKMALMGDALSHAVLPGVAIGFLWNMTKDPLAILIGATIAGLLGTFLVSAISRTTRLKEDAALGLVLATFFAIGICLVTMIQRLPTGNKSGLDKFLFGQAAALSAEDITLMAIVTSIAVVMVVAFYKELLASSFDPGFSRSIGLPTRWIHHGLMLLLTASVVIALQAVGVVLVSAMLITPASAAYLLTDRLHRLVVMAAAFGVGAGMAGAFLSFVGPSLPTGPLMVIGASALFSAAFLFGPRHGVVARWLLRRRGAARTQRENTLKSMFHVMEATQFRTEGVTLHDLAIRRRETIDDAQRLGRDLVRHGLATLSGDALYFTPSGRKRAGEIVRNHRLWELYLTQSANIAADHVHEDAEKIEHILGESVVRDLERRLGYATFDPHGRAIPSARTIHGGDARREGGNGSGK